MQRFTDRARRLDTPDEIWFLEHPPVFTLGMSGKREHVLAPGDIPVVQIDRGGQVTYHGPGQLVVYPLIDLRRAKLGVRDSSRRSSAPSSTTRRHSASIAECRRNAPGVYVRRAQARERRHPRAARRELPRPRAQRVHRSRALQPHQSLRLRGPAT